MAPTCNRGVNSFFAKGTTAKGRVRDVLSVSIVVWQIKPEIERAVIPSPDAQMGVYSGVNPPLVLSASISLCCTDLLTKQRC